MKERQKLLEIRVGKGQGEKKIRILRQDDVLDGMWDVAHHGP